MNDTDNIATVHIRITDSVVDEHTRKDENKARTPTGEPIMKCLVH